MPRPPSLPSGWPRPPRLHALQKDLSSRPCTLPRHNSADTRRAHRVGAGPHTSDRRPDTAQSTSAAASSWPRHLPKTAGGGRNDPRAPKGPAVLEKTPAGARAVTPPPAPALPGPNSGPASRYLTRYLTQSQPWL